MNRRVVALLPLLCLAASCGGGESFDRNALLASLGSVVFVPSYATLADATATLHTATATFCETPSQATLDAAQLAFMDAHAALVRTEAFAFGPYMTVSNPPETAINFWPARPNLADDVLSGTEPITLLSLPNAKKGFPILDYLLFDPVGGDGAVLAAFTDGGTGARRCSYVDVVTEDLAMRTAALHTEWAAPDGFAAQLATAGVTSTLYRASQQAIGDVLERVVFTLEDMRDMKLGVPLGLSTDNLAHPELVEVPYSARSFEALFADLESVEVVFTGDYAGVPGIGLSEWLVTRDAELDAAVHAQIGVVRAAILAFDVSLAEALEGDREALVALHAELRELHRLVGVDVAGALAVTISFNDTDGD